MVFRVIEGSEGEVKSLSDAKSVAKIGYPVLIKAAVG